MKVFFVGVNFEGEVKIPKSVISKLPGKVMLFVTVQLMKRLDSIVGQLEACGKVVLLDKPKHTVYEGQLLGCSIDRIEGDFDAFFYVGDGVFHPEALIIKNDKPVHIFNFASGKYSLLTSKDALVIRKRLAIAKSVFSTSKNIGVLMTTKQGQNRLSAFKKVIGAYPDKNFYFLLNNNVDFDTLEDFNFIECFVNTACERIAYDDYERFRKPVINFEDL